MVLVMKLCVEIPAVIIFFEKIRTDDSREFGPVKGLVAHHEGLFFADGFIQEIQPLLTGDAFRLRQVDNSLVVGP